MQLSNVLQNAFRENLRATLDEKDISQSDLAKRLGVTRSYISNILAGRHSPGLDVVERIADALEIDPHLMFEPQKIS
jgi:transcriptional regulator with XRE-family HTH domain